jgi:mannose-6-phosphate isomerase-like protein (cupin superfamily)
MSKSRGTVQNPMNIIDLPHRGRSNLLEGRLHGDVNVSLVFFDGPPGSGPKLHRHPYAEVFIIQEGHAIFTVGDATTDATAGHVLIAQPKQPHKFVNSGDGPLRLIGIHNGPKFIQEELEV